VSKDGKPVRGILKLLILKEHEKADATGYELIQKISAKTSKKPSPGSVYPLLRELTEAGLLNVRVEGKKKIYSLSDRGREVLKETSEKEKEAIRRKIEVLQTSGIIREDEAQELFQILSSKRSFWFRLFELRNWTTFLSLLEKLVERSREEVEEVIDDAIAKLRELERTRT